MVGPIQTLTIIGYDCNLAKRYILKTLTEPKNSTYPSYWEDLHLFEKKRIIIKDLKPTSNEYKVVEKEFLNTSNKREDAGKKPLPNNFKVLKI